MAIAFAISFASWLAPRAVFADDHPEEDDDELVWNHPRVRPWELALTFAAPIAVELLEVAAGPPLEPHWRGGILGEERIGDLFEAETSAGRERADMISDGIQWGTFVFPLIGDAILTAWLWRDSPDVAWQMAAIDLEAMAMNAIVTLGSIRMFVRARPLADDCARDPSYSPLCQTQEENRGFPSGHLASVVMGASLICLHHGELDLWGGGAADTAICATAIAASGANAVLRLMAARHYVSDLVVGTGIGFALGYLVPWLLHYQVDTDLVVGPMVDDTTIGARGALVF